jgi:hypothetical protein
MTLGMVTSDMPNLKLRSKKDIHAKQRIVSENTWHRDHPSDVFLDFRMSRTPWFDASGIPAPKYSHITQKRFSRSFPGCSLIGPKGKQKDNGKGRPFTISYVIKRPAVMRRFSCPQGLAQHLPHQPQDLVLL